MGGIIAVAISAAQNSPVRNQDYACETCHRSIALSQSSTAMGKAATRAFDTQVLKDNPTMQYVSGLYTYTIRREQDRVTYSVTDGKQTFSAPIVWAFGVGSIGQTYLYESRGDLYESQVSFYTPIKGLDITIGHGRLRPTSVEDAAGKRLQKQELSRCFECHTTGAGESLKAGVQCERCHVSAPQHARAAVNRTGPRVTPERLSQLSKDGLSDFCGGCHRTFQDIVNNGTININNVRSQPYRLATSKCYKASQDKRISCVGCHNPHEELVTSAEYYNAKCQGCHQAGGVSPSAKTCPVSKGGDCISCHMPRINFPDGHSRFTDHRIRIVRPGADYPE